MWTLIERAETPPFLFVRERKDIRFYDIDPAYATYLRQFDNRIPEITYTANNKFACGVVLSVDGHNYFAPKTIKNK